MQIWGQEMVNESTHKFWPLTEKCPYKILKNGQKYDVLQLMAKPKTVYKYAQNTMQD